MIGKLPIVIKHFTYMYKHFLLIILSIFVCMSDSTATAQSYESLETEHFSIVFDNADNQTNEIPYLLELSYEHFSDILNQHNYDVRPPAEKMDWIVFGDNFSFSQYALDTESADLSWLKGYYSAKTNKVAIVNSDNNMNWQVKSLSQYPGNVIAFTADSQTSLAKIVHETAHQLAFNTGLQDRLVMYPIWASEGFAMFFEQSFMAKYAQASKYTNIRGSRLKNLYAANNVIALDEFISISRCQSANAIDVYAQAWGVFQFLLEHKPQQLKNYFENLNNSKPGYKSDRTLYREFCQAFGDPENLEYQWEIFLSKL